MDRVAIPDEIIRGLEAYADDENYRAFNNSQEQKGLLAEIEDAIQLNAQKTSDVCVSELVDFVELLTMCNLRMRLELRNQNREWINEELRCLSKTDEMLHSDLNDSQENHSQEFRTELNIGESRNSNYRQESTHESSDESCDLGPKYPTLVDLTNSDDEDTETEDEVTRIWRENLESKSREIENLHGKLNILKKDKEDLLKELLELTEPSKSASATSSKQPVEIDDGSILLDSD